MSAHRPFRFLAIAASVLLHAGVGWTAEPADASAEEDARIPAALEALAPAVETGPPPLEEEAPDPLDEHLKRLLAIDRELTELERQIAESVDGQPRRDLQDHADQLRVIRADLIAEIEVLLEPAPEPAPEAAPARENPITRLEEQLDTRQVHHEAILESNVDTRLPSN